MSAGCNYYIAAQDVAHAHDIDTARLLSECVDLDFNYRETVHICDLCDKQLTDAELILLDDLPDKTCELTVDDKMYSSISVAMLLVSRQKSIVFQDNQKTFILIFKLSQPL